MPRALGLFVAGGFTSNIVINLLGPVLVGPLGWRDIIVVSSVLGLVVLAAFWFWADAGPAHRRIQGATVPTRWVWRTPARWLLGIVQFARLSVVLGFGFWLPAFLVVDRQMRLKTAGLIVALAAAITAPANSGGFVTSLLLGVILDITGSFGIGFLALAIIAAGGFVATVMLSRLPVPSRPTATFTR